MYVNVGNTYGVGKKRSLETIEKWRQATDVSKLKEASAKGKHTRWHIRRGIVNPACKFCL